jgi:hypothetical protein
MFNVLDIVLKFINGVYRGVKYPIVISFYFILQCFEGRIFQILFYTLIVFKTFI